MHLNMNLIKFTSDLVHKVGCLFITLSDIIYIVIVESQRRAG